MITSTCPECRGEGFVEVEFPVPHSFHRDIVFLDPRREPCPDCTGTGEVEMEDFDMIQRDEYERVCEENRKLRDLVKAKSPMAMMQMLKRFLGGNYGLTGPIEQRKEGHD